MRGVWVTELWGRTPKQQQWSELLIHHIRFFRPVRRHISFSRILISKSWSWKLPSGRGLKL